MYIKYIKNNSPMYIKYIKNNSFLLDNTLTAKLDVLAKKKSCNIFSN